MTTRALFRFSGPNQLQLACINNGDTWATQSQDDFIAANGANAAVARLWDALPYVPKPLDDFPQLEAALDKAREYLAAERSIRERMASYRTQGILADEAELLGKAADAYGRIVSMYLAKAASLFAARRYSANDLFTPTVGANDGRSAM
jgi:hypothetical protein